MDSDSPRWYLVRTKRHKELLVRQVLAGRIPNIFLPLLRTSRNNWGRVEETIEPLFPGYLFALFVLQGHYHAIQRTPGVVGIICSGDEPSEVDPAIIEEIKKHATNDIVTLWPKELKFGEIVSIVNGPLRGLAAIFDRYLSGEQRVALLVELVGGAHIRVTLPSTFVMPTVSNR